MKTWILDLVLYGHSSRGMIQQLDAACRTAHEVLGSIWAPIRHVLAVQDIAARQIEALTNRMQFVNWHVNSLLAPVSVASSDEFVDRDHDLSDVSDDSDDVIVIERGPPAAPVPAVFSRLEGTLYRPSNETEVLMRLCIQANLEAHATPVSSRARGSNDPMPPPAATDAHVATPAGRAVVAAPADRPA